MAHATSSWRPEPGPRARFADPAAPDKAPRGEPDAGRSGRQRRLSQQSIGLTLDHGDDSVVVRVSGEIDSRTAPQLSAAIHRQLDAGTCRRVVVDLRRVKFIGAQGVMVLENARQHAEAFHIDFCIVVEGRAVLRPLQALGMIESFELCDEPEP
jgi:anti-sigma B factor antagonist